MQLQLINKLSESIPSIFKDTLGIFCPLWLIFSEQFRSNSKIKQSYKPGSVMLPKEHALSFIWACRHQQALAPYPQEQSEDLRRAASSLAYLDFQLLRFAITAVANCVVGSYPAFSPLPHFAMRRYFLCGTGCRRLVALPLPSR